MMGKMSNNVQLFFSDILNPVYLICVSGTHRFRKLVVSVPFKSISYLGFCPDKYCPIKSSLATWEIPISRHTGREQWWSQALLAFWPIHFLSLCLGDVAGAETPILFAGSQISISTEDFMTYFENTHKAFLCFMKLIMTGNGREDILDVRWHVSMPGWGTIRNWRGSYLSMLWYNLSLKTIRLTFLVLLKISDNFRIELFQESQGGESVMGWRHGEEPDRQTDILQRLPL